MKKNANASGSILTRQEQKAILNLNLKSFECSHTNCEVVWYQGTHRDIEPDTEGAWCPDCGSMQKWDKGGNYKRWVHPRHRTL